MVLQGAGAVAHRILSNSTLSFSSLIGPLEDITFYGHPITYMASNVYGQPHVGSLCALISSGTDLHHMIHKLVIMNLCSLQLHFWWQAMHLHFQSYADKMAICLSVDPDVIPDADKLLDDLEESLKLIRDAVVETGLPIAEEEAVSSTI